MYTTLLTEMRGAVLLITLNRPHVLNSLNREVFAELEAALRSAEAEPGVRAIVLNGAGEKAFAAGADIAEIPINHSLDAEQMSRKVHSFLFYLEDYPKPVLAAIHGFALGGGCELAMACHLRIAAEGTHFGLPEVKLGLIPGFGGTQRLPRLIGKTKALELMLTGDMLSAEDALQLGLINYVVPKAELLPRSLALMEKILAQSSVSHRYIIDAVNGAHRHGTDGYDVEAVNFAAACNTGDGQEGTAAFLQKRKPNFTGK